MRGAKRVVFALGALGEAGQAVALAERADAVAPSGEDLVWIGLMADVPDQAVARRVENVVQGNRQFDDAQTSRRTTRVTTGRDIGVRLLYWTAFVDGQGRVAFREDVYRRDEKLAQALGIAVSLPRPIDDGRQDANDVGP